jgi:two-component system response regulator DegU
VDDFEPFRRFVRSMLSDRPEVQVIAEASDGLEAVQMARQFQPNLMLLDIGLPKLSGIDAAREIRKRAPKTKIIFSLRRNSLPTLPSKLSMPVERPTL